MTAIPKLRDLNYCEGVHTQYMVESPSVFWEMTKIVCWQITGIILYFVSYPQRRNLLATIESDEFHKGEVHRDAGLERVAIFITKKVSIDGIFFTISWGFEQNDSKEKNQKYKKIISKYETNLIIKKKHTNIYKYEEARRFKCENLKNEEREHFLIFSNE